jgi:hypothetical protein
MADKRIADRAADADPTEEAQYAMHCIQEALRGLRFGFVTVVVQDGVVVQVERTEKRRLRDRRSDR